MSIFDRLRGDGDTVTMASALSLQASFTVSSASAAGSTLNETSWTFSTDRNDYYVWYNQTGPNNSPADPALAGVSIPVTIPLGASAGLITDLTVAALVKLSGELGVVEDTPSSWIVTIREFADVTDAADVDTGFGFTINASGLSRPEINAERVILASGGNIHSLVNPDGSVFNLEGSTFVLREKNLFPITGSDLVASAGDTPVNSDNLSLPASALGGLGSQIGGIQ